MGVHVRVLNACWGAEPSPDAACQARAGTLVHVKLSEAQPLCKLGRVRQQAVQLVQLIAAPESSVYVTKSGPTSVSKACSGADASPGCLSEAVRRGGGPPELRCRGSRCLPIPPDVRAVPEPPAPAHGHIHCCAHSRNGDVLYHPHAAWGLRLVWPFTAGQSRQGKRQGAMHVSLCPLCLLALAG